MISDFKDKKLVEYLEPGMKVLIRFGHGWGDTQMFMPAFWILQRRFPNVTIDIYLECGQEEIFVTYPEKDSKEHDLVFSLNFPMSEGSAFTKVEKCCIEEIGIKPFDEFFPTFQRYRSPFVACHFQGTALPNSVNCPEATAQKIWNEVIEAGYIPIECHFEHCFHNPVNAKYGFISNSVRGCRAELSKLIGLIQHSFAFIGVASGPLITALCVMPTRTMYLERTHKLSSYTRMDIAKTDVMNYQDGTLKAWLESLN